jgi:hypothetical protein
MSFGRKVARNLAHKSGEPFNPRPRPAPKVQPLRDVRSQISGLDGSIQCPQCHSSEALVHMTCEEFGVTSALKKAHDELGGPGHDHVRCRNCNQFIIYTLSEQTP